MQLLITAKTRENFDSQVNSTLHDGATIVSGTLAIGMVAFQKANGDNYLQSRYAAIVELTAEQSVACQAAIAERDARAGGMVSCGCSSANDASDDASD